MPTQNAFAPAADAERATSVVVHFPAQGRQLPADHGYALYSAVTRALPELHGQPWLGLELVSGVPWREGVIALPARGASLRFRVPAEHYRLLLPLAGRRLDISGHPLRLGIPSARPLRPAPSLYARCVTIKKFTDPEPFLDAARRQLEALGVAAALELPVGDDGRVRRRVITIRDRRVVGFSLAAHGLNDPDSLLLQTHGLGGRRSMGCGHFNPIVRPTITEERDDS
jgi:CRISPR-associated protein Cas6